MATARRTVRSVGRGRGAIAVGLALAVLALTLAGCGASHRSARLPAAEPSRDSTLPAHPAGTIVAVGDEPQGIAVQASTGRVAVGVRNPSAVVLLSTHTGRIVARIPLTAPVRHLEVGGSDGPFLLPEERADTLLELTEPAGTQRSFRVGDFPHDAAEADGIVVVSDERGRGLSEIEPDGSVHRIAGFTQPGGVAADGGDVAVVDVGAFTLSLLDVHSGRVIGRLPAGAGPTHCVAAGNRIWVTDTRGNAVITYSLRPFRRLSRTPVPGTPYGIGLDPVHHRLWVTETARNRVAELSLTGRSPQIIATFATQIGPDTVAVDSRTGRAYVANQGSGSVEIITPAR